MWAWQALSGVWRGVAGTAGVHAGLGALMEVGAQGGMTGCARGARPRGVTPAPFPKFAEFFRTDGTVTRPGGGSDLILAPGTWYEVLRGETGRREGAGDGEVHAGAGTLSGLARQGGSTKELSVRVHFVRFEPARSGGSPTSKSPPPTSVSLRSTS